MPKSQSGKTEKHMASSKGPEAIKEQHVEVPKEPEVQSVDKPEAEVQKKASIDDYVEVNVPPPPPPENLDIPESSMPNNTVLPDIFEGFPNIRGEFKDDFIIGEEFDMFHDTSVKELKKKMSFRQKEKEKAEADRDALKKQVEELTKVNEEIKSVMIKQAKKLKKLEEDVQDNTHYLSFYQ
ncbi:hypothetical protein Hanom_Chr04g00301711 [Helianthus anomalus]